jgi:hypothetical protein
MYQYADTTHLSYTQKKDMEDLTFLYKQRLYYEKQFKNAQKLGNYEES